MSSESIIEQVKEYMLTDEFTESFEEFATKNCDTFDNRDENKLEYTQIYQQFKDLFEGKLESMCFKLLLY
jgi:hypothetical protein